MPRPTIYPLRQDLLYEDDVTLDGSGNYTSPYFDSSGLVRLRFAADYNPLSAALSDFYLNEYMLNSGGSAILVRQQSIPVSYPGLGYAELDLTSRYFQFTASGTANDVFELIVRGLSS